MTGRGTDAEFSKGNVQTLLLEKEELLEETRQELEDLSAKNKDLEEKVRSTPPSVLQHRRCRCTDWFQRRRRSCLLLFCMSV